MIESLCAIFRDVYTPQVVSKIHLIRDWYHGFGFCFRGYYRPFGPVILSLFVTSLCRVGGAGLFVLCQQIIKVSRVVGLLLSLCLLFWFPVGYCLGVGLYSPS